MSQTDMISGDTTETTMAQTGAEVLAGRPFCGSVFKKPPSRGADPIFLGVVQPQEALTIDEARREIAGFCGNLLIHTELDGKAIEISVNVGRMPGQDDPYSKSDPVEELGQRMAHHYEKRDAEVVREKYERKITRIREEHDDRLKRAQQCIEHERTKRRDLEDEVARQRRQHTDDTEALRRSHREEIERLRAKMDRLRDEKNDLYIETRLAGERGSTLDRVVAGLVENLPAIAERVAPLLGDGEHSSTEPPMLDASSGSPSTDPRTSTASHTADVNRDEQFSHMKPFDRMDRDEKRGFLVGQVLAVAKGELSKKELRESLPQILKAIERVEKLTESEWAEMVNALAIHAIHQEVPAPQIGDAVEPVLRRFVREGSKGEALLRQMPPRQAAGMLVGMSGQEVTVDVRKMIENVLAYYKEKLQETT